MKKLLAAICPLIAVSAFALDIDEAGAKVVFTGYKMQNKTAVPASFTSVKLTFAKTSGSVAEMFFANLASQESSGKITSVTGDDTKGELKATIKFNNVEQEIPMTYEVKDGKIVATGAISLEKDFGAKDAFEKFSSEKIIAGLHGGKTWEDVQIGFEIPVK